MKPRASLRAITAKVAALEGISQMETSLMIQRVLGETVKIFSLIMEEESTPPSSAIMIMLTASQKMAADTTI